MSIDFLVERDNLAHSELKEVSPLQPALGEVVIRVERFALTANNITYGVAGDLIGYWNFFPAPQGWGRIPVWGLGTVTLSEHPNVAVGERYYGYFPMSQELLVQPEKVTERGFTDASAHRAELPVVYNQYTVVNPENGFEPGLDNHAMLYRPLFTTSYVLDDYLADNQFFAADTIILGSASSKTAFGLAFLLQRREGIKVVGLTSAKNRTFVQNLGLYDSVVTYAEVESLPVTPSAYIDMAGNREVLARVHHHLQDDLMCSCGVGITHWSARDGEAPDVLPGAKPTMFFAPTQIVKRNKELGPVVYQQKIYAATQEFLAQVDRWVHIEEHPFSDVKSVYETVLNGASPDLGYVVLGVS